MARLAGSDVERRRRSDRRASARTRDAAVTLPARQAEDVAAAAQLACLLEASAPKPGNVSPFASFRDATYEDFLASAARSEEHTSELQSHSDLVCRLLLEKKKYKDSNITRKKYYIKLT